MRSEHARAGMRAALLLPLAHLLAACSGGSGLNDSLQTLHIRTLNLVEDSPSLATEIDETTVASTGYAAASAFSAAYPGRRNITFAAALPGDLDDDDDEDETTTPIGSAITHHLLADTDYTLVAYGRMDAFQTYLVEGLQQRDEVDDDHIALSFTHAAPGAPAVDIYVTVPEAGIATGQYVSTLSLTQSSQPLDLTLNRDDDDLDDDSTLVGKVVIELFATGTSQRLLRSHPIAIGEGNRVLVAIADAAGAGPAPVKLVLAGGVVGEYRDRSDNASLALAHVSFDTPAVDLTTGSTLRDPLAQNVTFGQRSAYAPVASGEVPLLALRSGTTDEFLFFEEFTATPGLHYTAYAMGPLASVDAVILQADARSVPTQATFRFLHAAASLEEADALDIYLRLPDEPVDFDDDDTSATYASVQYQSATAYATLVPGSYDAYFAFAGTSSILLGPVRFTIAGGEVRTIVLTDTASSGYEVLPVLDSRP